MKRASSFMEEAFYVWGVIFVLLIQCNHCNVEIMKNFNDIDKNDKK
jgi:hypothetical protein